MTPLCSCGCGRQAWARGLANACYLRERRTRRRLLKRGWNDDLMRGLAPLSPLAFEPRREIALQLAAEVA